MGKRRCNTSPYVKHPESKTLPGGFDTPNLGGRFSPLSRGLQINDSALQRDCDGVRSVACSKFGENALDVPLDCFLGDRELIANQLVCIPAGNQAQYIDFSCGQSFIDHVICEYSRDLTRYAFFTSMYSANRLKKLLPQKAL